MIIQPKVISMTGGHFSRNDDISNVVNVVMNDKERAANSLKELDPANVGRQD